MVSQPIESRIKEFQGHLDDADGLGLAISDLAKKCHLSKHRVRQILEIMHSGALVVRAQVQGSGHNYGMNLYFSPHHFGRIANIEIEPNKDYKLRQTTIFEFVREAQ